MKGQLHAPAAVSPEIASTNSIPGWTDPRAGVDAVGKRLNVDTAPSSHNFVVTFTPTPQTEAYRREMSKLI